MKLYFVMLLFLGLTSCASSAYNPSFIMGDNRKVEIDKEPITQSRFKVEHID
jgi:hypothetical protein